MIHYSILPLETVYEGIEAMKSSTVDIVMNGVRMQVEPVNAQQAKIVRLISCNPQDFLDPRYAPGRMIEFQPMVRESGE